ncbi:type II secretory pathway pseudopilin PulG [Pseudomonas alcaligenes]|uniref:Type II secretory pathway pseudopilin PulG n=1 Tax=Aquipseudomonas alcaligenes TaxID=43263 RepID=A0ABR7S4M2_AQUAC|nr:prepilin-type N-terminal cleavage/methylation domain-containing protein [Pseudomonas alcaligenes]MBC9252516.1 type II secretory pathway pseudopilin PulG [Pseudomonas alcaligenes]
MRRRAGFTLVELVMVIALSGLVAMMIGTVLSRPLEGFAGQSRRALLVDQAAGALNRITRDVRLAVPNSLRVSADGLAVELLLIHSAARYRPNRTGSEGLRFASDTAGTCGSSTTGGRCDSVQVLDATLNPAGANWMVLYNIGAETGGNPTPGSNVWATSNNPGVITPTGTTFSVVNGTPTGESQIILGNLPSGGFRFAFASPERRLYLAQSVVGYRCQNGQLVRYSYTALQSNISNSPPVGSNPQPVVANVASCSFIYQAGSTQRAGLLTLNLGLTQNGESLQLLQQVHVDNAP